jgi:hypothetical protein
MPAALLAELEHSARAHGFDLFGVVDAQRFDAAQPVENRCSRLLPDCGTAIVVGRGGPDKFDGRALAELGRVLRQRGLRVRVASPLRSSISFACLGEAAGLGIVSPVIHRLLHPQFGPWVTVHGVLLVSGRPFGPIADASIAETFHPCCKCHRPCVEACPAEVHDGHGESDFGRCHEHRHAGGCGDACLVVRACPIGSGQRVEAAREADRHRDESRLLAVRHAHGFWAWFWRLWR